MTEFAEFPKIARYSRDVIVTEKIDGTNAQVFIVDTKLLPLDSQPVVTYVNGNAIFAGSRNRYITPDDDNFGFAAWVRDHADELVLLGHGRHFGEWWGSGIQRGYGLAKGEKRWSLFNVSRWHAAGATPIETKSVDPRQPSKFSTEAPSCCSVVPILAHANFDAINPTAILGNLRTEGSRAAPGFMNPEGIVIFHVAGGVGFKKTLDRDGLPKGVSL